MLLHSSFLNHPYTHKGKGPLNITCSLCYKGILKPSKHIEEQSAATKEAHKEMCQNPYAQDLAFYSLVCNNKDCGESYMVIGNTFIDFVYTENHYSNYPEREEIDVFKPLFFTPPIHLFVIHKSIPKQLREELINSFNLFFADFSAAANKVRIALEILMNDLKISKTNSKGKDLTLHNRIELFEKSDPTLGEQLLSIKIVGNSGSHQSSIERADVVIAYEIIEHVLDELYVRKARMLDAQSKAKKLSSKAKQIKAPSPSTSSSIPPPTPTSSGAS